MYRRQIAMSLFVLTLAVTLAACSQRNDAPGSPAADSMATATPDRTPEPVSASENVKPFAIGKLPAFALRDGALEFPNDNKVFGVGHTPEEVAAELSAAGAPTDKIQLSIQPLLEVRRPRAAIRYRRGHELRPHRRQALGFARCLGRRSGQRH